MNNLKKNHQGVTIIELLITLAIGAALLTSTVTLLISNKHTYRHQNETSRLQENARFAISTLTEAIRHAAYYGCVGNPQSDQITTNTALTAGSLQDITVGIEGSENATNWSPSGATHKIANIVAGTDAITVRSLQRGGTNLIPPYMVTETDSIYISIPNTYDFEAGDLVALTDCNHIDIFTITAAVDTDVNPANGTDDTRELRHAAGSSNISSALGKTYNSDNNTNSKLNRFDTARFYIGAGTNGNSLFRSVSDTATDNELVEDIEDMQIMYGVDSNGDFEPNNYYVAGDGNLDSTSEWNNVVSVRITLTLKAPGQDLYAGAIQTQTISTTINLRNRTSELRPL